MIMIGLHFIVSAVGVSIISRDNYNKCSVFIARKEVAIGKIFIEISLNIKWKTGRKIPDR